MHNKREQKGEICKAIGKMAADALRAEAKATPKPGLVDRENSGAHRDMDYPLFLASCSTLEPYFGECAAIGQSCRKCGETGNAGKTGNVGAMQALRSAGLAAEAAMFAETGGVNTHKGMVFSMGILCFSIGQMQTELEFSRKEIDLAELQRCCAEVAAVLLGEVDPLDTHGALVLQQTGTGGIRKEALSGFASAFQIGYPALVRAMAAGLDWNTALIKTLLVLMREVEDSNAVHRGGEEGLAFLRRRSAEILQRADFSKAEALDMVREFDRECTTRNLSPGGSADLLALSVMLYRTVKFYSQK